MSTSEASAGPVGALQQKEVAARVNQYGCGLVRVCMKSLTLELGIYVAPVGLEHSQEIYVSRLVGHKVLGARGPKIRYNSC